MIHLEVAMFPGVRAADQAFWPLTTSVLSAWSVLALLISVIASHLR